MCVRNKKDVVVCGKDFIDSQQLVRRPRIVAIKKGYNVALCLRKSGQRVQKSANVFVASHDRYIGEHFQCKFDGIVGTAIIREYDLKWCISLGKD